jgi:hypothetical protein
VFWIGKTAGWRQSDGKVNLDVAGTGTIKHAILRIPAQASRCMSRKSLSAAFTFSTRASGSDPCVERL